MQTRHKFVFVYRNPKDVAVSFYHHTRGIAFYDYDGKFENFIKLFMSEQGRLKYVVVNLLKSF